MNRRIAAAVVAVLLAAADSAWTQPAPERPAVPEQGPNRAGPRQAEENLRRSRERLRRIQGAARQRRALRQGQEVSESVSRTARIGRDGSLDLRNIAGRVVVTGVNGDDVRIEAVKRVWHQDPEQARALLKLLDVEITEGTARVSIRTRYPQQQAYDAEVDYTVSVPQQARVTLRAGSGDVMVSNVRGELTAEAMNGSVTASSIGDVRLLRSVSGDVSVDGAEGVELTASTIGGAITVRRAKARTMDLRSVGGAVQVTDGDADRVIMRALTGNIEYGGRISRSGRYDMQSRSGRIVVVPAGSEGFDVDAFARSGEFRSDFPLTLRERASGSGRGNQRVRLVQGTFGDGGGLLTLRSYSGGITIERR
jgi:hypothetical protein